MTKKKPKIFGLAVWTIILLICINLAGWAFYNLIQDTISVGLTAFSGACINSTGNSACLMLANEFMQNVFIVIGVIVLILAIGYPVSKAFKDMIT